MVRIEDVSEHHLGWVQSVAFSHDGTRAVSGATDGLVKIWNASTGEVELVLKGHSRVVTSVAFSRHGTRVASGSWDLSVRVWNAVTGDIECVLRHSGYVLSVAFSHDGTRVVSGAFDGTVTVWYVATRGTQRTLEGLRKAATWPELVLRGHSDDVNSVAFSRDDTRVVSGSRDKTVRIWNVNTGEIERVLEGLPDLVLSVAFSPDGTHVISGSLTGTVLIWDAITGQSTPLFCHESFRFLDGSKVTHIVRGKFQLFAPDKEELLLSPDWKWILTRRSNQAFWIPREYRDIISHAISGSKVCLGCFSGRVVIVDLAPRQPDFRILSRTLYPRSPHSIT